jgi:hypothetical protein
MVKIRLSTTASENRTEHAEHTMKYGRMNAAGE